MEKIKKDEIITAAKQYMQRHGMSQNALARTCGISASYLSNLLNGVYEYNPALTRLRRSPIAISLRSHL